MTSTTELVACPEVTVTVIKIAAISKDILKTNMAMNKTCPDLAAQCLKCLMPVNTIAKLYSSAAAITSSSRFEPPG